MISDPPGSFINGNDSSFRYLVGSDVNVTCLVTPAPPSDSEYSWSCSTGCFVDMEIEQSVYVSELELTDEGILNCSVMIDGVEFVSDPFELVVLGKKICSTVGSMDKQRKGKIPVQRKGLHTVSEGSRNHSEIGFPKNQKLREQTY